MANLPELDTKRIQLLTDGIFAVAMTILILEVKIPLHLSSYELNRYFLDHTLPELFIYFIGFVTLGIFWIGSHYHHHHLQKTDRVSSWLNIFFLLFICIIPFAIAFLKGYRHEKLSIIFYCIDLIVASALNYFMLWYAWKQKYISPYFTFNHFIHAKHRVLIPIYIYLAIIFISFFSTYIAIFLFLIPVILHIIPEKGNIQNR